MPSKCRHDGTRPEGYQRGISESTSGPIYSQPHRPIPADMSTFTFVETEIENTYAEPSQGSSLNHITASTPPPIPSSPPGSPTSTSSGKISGGVQPPPKPQRILPLDTIEDPDDYDHLTIDTHSFRSKKKPPAVRDKENNIFSKGQSARAPTEEDSKDYDHVDPENEYSEISMPKAGNTNFRMPR